MKTIHIAPLAFAAAAVLATACTDYSDYNEAYSDGSNPAANQTLAENITSRPELSKFAALAHAVGFDRNLASAHTYTVFAPLDEYLDATQYAGADSATIAARFIRNHVADFSIGASGENVSQRVKMLNNKTILLEGAPGAYTFGGVPVQEANIPNTNGLLYLLKGQAHYYPNLYEYIQYAEGIDSVRAYFKQHEIVTLDEKNSVAGPIVDGKQTWVHQAYNTSNWLTRALSAQFEAEDSSYTFLIPNNDAWNERYAEVKKSYHYISSMAYNDFSGDAIAAKTQTVDNAYITDSLCHLNTLRGLVYSNYDTYNNPILDTIRTTNWNKLSNPDELLSEANIAAKETMSNGQALIMSHIADRPWETYLTSKRAGIITTAAGLKSCSRERREYIDPVTGDKITYDWLKPAGKMSKPDASFLFENTLATTYRLYVVWVPDSVSEYGLLPNNNMFEMTYCTDKGKLTKLYFDAKTHTTQTKEANCESYFTHRSNIASGELDTMYIGEISLPVAYAGVAGSANTFGPTLRIYTKWSGSMSANLKKWNTDIRIYGIYLRPVAEDEHDPWRKDGNDPE